MSRRWRFFVLTLGLLALCGGCSWLFEPEIAVSPSQGAVHTLVTIRGSGFGEAPGDNQVFIWSMLAPIVSWHDEEIVCRVPVVPTPGGDPVETTLSLHLNGSYLDVPFTVVRGILFQTNREGDWEIYVMNPDGSGQTNLSRNYAQDKAPCWCPQGLRIAFEVHITGQETDLRVMDADGANRASLTDSPYHMDGDPRWAPDGSKIVFWSEWDLTPEIWTIEPDGTGPVQLTNFNIVGVSSPCWSPDGTRIAFSGSNGQTENDLRIAVMNANGTGAVYITPAGYGDDSPSWSPDGQWIAFERNRTDEGDAALMAIHPDGSGTVRLTGSSVHNPASPSWSPDGSAIAFSASPDGSSPHEIYLLDLAAGTVTRLTHDSAADASPFWGS